MAFYKCDACCLLIDGEVDVCPKCGAKKEHLIKVADDHEAKIVAADRTNTLLASLVTLADELRVLAQEGKDINLDPGCLRVFTHTLEKVDEVKRFAKAEIEIHTRRNKW